MDIKYIGVYIGLGIIFGGVAFSDRNVPFHVRLIALIAGIFLWPLFLFLLILELYLERGSGE